MQTFLSKFILATLFRTTFYRYAKMKLNGAGKYLFNTPLIIQIYATENCNMHCPMCHAYESRKRHLKKCNGRDLDPEVLKKVFKEMRPYQPMYYITGGEPLMYTHLTDIIKNIKINKSILGLVTNGYRLGEFYKPIVDEGVKFISISLDGSTAEVHDKSRGKKGAYEKTISNIEKLIDYRANRLFPRIKINTVIRKENIDDLVNIFDLNKSLGVDEMSLEHFSYYYDEIQKNTHLAAIKQSLGNEVVGYKINRVNYLSDEQISILKEKLKTIETLAKKYKIKYELKPKTNDVSKYYSGCLPSKKSKCESMYFNARIRQSGDIELCQGVTIGNIYHDSLYEAWQSQNSKRFRSYFMQFNNSPACFRCLGLNYYFD